MSLRPSALLVIVFALAAACQDYSKKSDAKTGGPDGRRTDRARSSDVGGRESSPRRDGAGEKPPAREGGLLPDRCSTPATCPVLFSYDKGSETKVEVFGSFNGWSTGVPMTLVGAQWQATIPLNNGEQVLYKFVLDGTTWIPDPKNPNQTTDGKKNSILDVACPTSCPG